MPRPALAPLSMLMRRPAPAFTAAVLGASATYTAPATAQETLRGEVPEELREGPPGGMSDRQGERQDPLFQPRPAPAGPE